MNLKTKEQIRIEYITLIFVVIGLAMIILNISNIKKANELEERAYELQKDFEEFYNKWLEENCECVECFYESEYIKISLHNEEFCGGKCLKYKCK